MLKRRVQIILVILISICCRVNAQPAIFLSTFLGINNMKDMKNFQKDYINTVQKGGDRVDHSGDFGPSLQADLEVVLRAKKKNNWGAFVNLASSKTSLTTTYSDSYAYDEIRLSRKAVGVSWHRAILNGFGVSARVGYCYSNVKQLESRYSPTSATDFEIKSHSSGIVFMPTATYSIEVTPNVTLRARAGYEFNKQGRTYYDSQPTFSGPDYLINDQGDPIKLNWSGLRVGIAVGYCFLRSEKK